MKRFCALLMIGALLLLPQTAFAAERADIAVGDKGDDVLRAQLRLLDLGFTDADATGVWRRADENALSDFMDAGGEADALFDLSVPRRSPDAAEETEIPAVVYGGAMPWSEVRTRLSADKSYVLTDCATGVTVRVRCIAGEHHAEVQPVLSWDMATMASIFSAGSPLDARPVVLSVDGMLAAASLRLGSTAADQTETNAQLYFKGSGSGFAGLADADHDAAVAAATAK